MRTIRIVIVCLLILGVFTVTQVVAAHDTIIGDSVVTYAPKLGGTVYNMDMIIMHGNYTWIPLNLKGTPESNKIYILGALNAFEKKFPIEVLSFQIEQAPHAYAVYGIWVYHRPKLEQ